MMMRRIVLTAALGAAALAAPPSSACEPPIRPEQLPGESTRAYEARLTQLDREQEQTRQAEAFRQAGLILIARHSLWAGPHMPAPVHRPSSRPVYRPKGLPIGRPLAYTIPPPPPPRGEIGESGPIYFKPVAWFRGQQAQALFRVERGWTMCGPSGFGDTPYSRPGNLYVFFARAGPLSENTLIDAIALDKVDDPALLTFVAKYRSKAQAPIR